MSNSLLQHFSTMEDPRIELHKLYSMESIIFITICAVLSGCGDWEEIEEYGEEKKEWLSKFISLPHGIPSHDTINRLFSRLKPLELQKCFLSWVQSVVSTSKNNIVHIDGKRICNGGVEGSKSLIHLVNAWSSSNQIILGQIKTEQKSNEISAIPTLLEMLELEGAIVTIDAMGCQNAIAEKIRECKADYVLAVKGNQGYLEDDLREAFQEQQAIPSATTIETGHGRIEKRTCRVITDLSWISRLSDWKDLQSLICVNTERTNKQTGEMQTEQRLYISSKVATPQEFNKIIRSHWSIENQLHWSLDVTFAEDKSTKQAGNAAENFSMINKAALSILKNDTTQKASIKRKRNRCGWNNQILETILFTQF